MNITIEEKMHRNTFVEINLANLKYNVESLIKKYSDYSYFFGVVKADCYGHGINAVKAIIDGGCNYLAVATLDEALQIRRMVNDIPILCLGIIDPKYIKECVDNNITITVSNKEYLNRIDEKSKLKIHVKINTGMNRLGIDNRDDLNEVCRIIEEKNYYLEGLYTHIYNACSEGDTLAQYDMFEEITRDIDLTKIPIIHLGASEATELYKKKDYANACRLGISMYGLIDCGDIVFKPTFSLYSEVIQINNVKDGVVGYDGAYRVNSKENIAIVPVGYADGIIRKNTGRDVFIGDRAYKIVGNICMDMLFIKVDDSVRVGDKVTIIRDIDDIKNIAKYLDTIPYEVLCSVGKRVPRFYKD